MSSRASHASQLSASLKTYSRRQAYLMQTAAAVKLLTQLGFRFSFSSFHTAVTVGARASWGPLRPELPFTHLNASFIVCPTHEPFILGHEQASRGLLCSHPSPRHQLVSAWVLMIRPTYQPHGLLGRGQASRGCSVWVPSGARTPQCLAGLSLVQALKRSPHRSCAFPLARALLFAPGDSTTPPEQGWASWRDIPCPLA